MRSAVRSLKKTWKSPFGVGASRCASPQLVREGSRPIGPRVNGPAPLRHDRHGPLNDHAWGD
jgi:hypothetical protein